MLPEGKGYLGVHFFSFLSFHFSFDGRGERREKGQGIGTLSAGLTHGGDGDGDFHQASGHSQWSSHIGCTQDSSFFTQGHREGMMFFLLPETVLACQCLKKTLGENRVGLVHIM